MAEEYGEFRLNSAEPHTGRRWTDSRRPRAERSLKARDAGEERTLTFPPDLTQWLHRHILRFGYGRDGRLFCGERGGEIPLITYTRAWRAVRKIVFTEDVQGSPLADRPYALRHGCVSTWLLAGVDPALAALWTGRSIKVLLEVYATFLDGGEEAAKRKIESVLGPRRL